MPREVIGDPVRFKQVLTNLVSNAIKFTKHGTVELSVQPIATTNDTVSIRVSVRDQGIGIPPEKLESIFSAFTQVDTTTSRQYGGTGLGLAICQRMIQAMGGTIKVESKQDVGSHFWFEVTLPRSNPDALAKHDDKNATLSQQEEAHPPADRSHWNLLLVEDIKINRILAQKLLEQQGHTITTASDGQMALDLVASLDFDAVLMDLHMPVLDGMEATRKIRMSEDPVKASIPILALTADISNDNIEKFRESGFDAYCTKPLDIEAIETELSRLVHRKFEFRNKPPQTSDA